MLVVLAWVSPSAATSGRSGVIGPEQGCSSLTEELVPPEAVGLPDVAPWRPAPVAKRSESLHPFMYVPKLASVDDDGDNLRDIDLLPFELFACTPLTDADRDFRCDASLDPRRGACGVSCDTKFLRCVRSGDA